MKYRIVEESQFDGGSKFYIEMEFSQVKYKNDYDAADYGYYNRNSAGLLDLAAEAKQAPQLETAWRRAGTEYYETLEQAQETLKRITFVPELKYHAFPA